MMWDPLAVLLLLLLPFVSCFPREKTTEDPEMPLLTHPKQRRPTHISEFTDPDTGLNPFLDLEEGRTAEGRTNVMEDERQRGDEPPPPPSFDFDLVEGDATDRRWNLGGEPLEPPRPRPKPDVKNSGDFHVETTARIPPSTTVRSYIIEVKTPSPDVTARDVETRHKVKKEEKGSSSYIEASQGTVIYATSAVAVLTVAVLLTGIWWRRRRKTSSRSPVSVSVENGDVKS